MVAGPAVAVREDRTDSPTLRTVDIHIKTTSQPTLRLLLPAGDILRPEAVEPNWKYKLTGLWNQENWD